MRKFFGDHYKGILASIIAALVVAGLLWMCRAFLTTIPEKITIALMTKFTVPLYVGILIFVTGLACPLVCRRRKASRFDDYVRDEVHGLIWEWTNCVIPRPFTPLCPRCLAELLIRDENQTEYGCVSCGFKKKAAFQHKVMLKVVAIEIAKRERTSEWKKAKKRLARAKKVIGHET